MTGVRSSVIGHRSSVIGHRSSVIGHRSSVIGHRSSVIGHRSSVIRHPSSVIRHPSSVIGHRSSVIGHSPHDFRIQRKLRRRIADIHVGQQVRLDNTGLESGIYIVEALTEGSHSTTIITVVQ
jgi:hypothetical protein